MGLPGQPHADTSPYAACAAPQRSDASPPQPGAALRCLANIRENPPPRSCSGAPRALLIQFPNNNDDNNNLLILFRKHARPPARCSGAPRARPPSSSSSSARRRARTRGCRPSRSSSRCDDECCLNYIYSYIYSYGFIWLVLWRSVIIRTRQGPRAVAA